MTLQEFKKVLVDYGNEYLPEELRGLIEIPDTSDRMDPCLYICNVNEENVVHLIKSVLPERNGKPRDSVSSQIAKGLLSFEADPAQNHKEITEIFPDKSESELLNEERLRLIHNIKKSFSQRNKSIYQLIKAARLEAFIETPDNSIQSNAQSPENKKSTMKQFPLNQILYGPPGTGKTYHTIN